MKNPIALLENQRSAGLLITRVLAGGIILWAGWGKLMGPGFSGIGGGFAKMGIPVPEVTGPFILLLETLGGLALILGLFTRYLGVLFVIEFVVAFFAIKMGMGYSKFRIDVALIAFAVLFATHGGGKYSLDKVLKLEN